MASYSDDFPFGIMDVVELLQIRVRRRSPQGVYTDCPICNDRRGKLHIHIGKNTWHCNYCQEGGGMLALYARVYNISTSDAYREICDSLQLSGSGENARQMRTEGSSGSPWCREVPAGEPQVELASRQNIHQTYSMLLDMLSLRPAHMAHLCSEKRGLTQEQVTAFRFKSTPPPFICHRLTENLIKKGCIVEGVPGFYKDKNGKWTVRFSTYTAGILLPVMGFDGLIQGLHIFLDKPLKNKNDPPEAVGAKYIWLSSAGKYMGAGSGSPVLLVGDPSARTVYVTEGILKAYIAHTVMNRTFIASAGANNLGQMEPLFKLLANSGTELIIEAQDMDKFFNENVAKSASKIYLLARQNGMEYRCLTWNPNYKGIDDWALALRRRDRRMREENMMNFKDKYLRGLCSFDDLTAHIDRWRNSQNGVGLARYLGLNELEFGTLCSKSMETFESILANQRRMQNFRVYQLDFKDQNRTIPFAFQGIERMHEAGYEQPPAALYRFIWDGSITSPIAWHEEEVLRQICDCYGDQMPEDYMGRPIAPSDVIELYDGEDRRFYYVDTNGFVLVRFSPFLAKKQDEIERGG